MIQENKELLLKDLCGRLPYGVKAKYYDPEAERTTCDEIDDIYNTTSVDHVEVGIGQYGLHLTEVKPYLFPISSMTEEQRDVIDSIASSSSTVLSDVVDFYNKNHIDYRSLIPKGLAIDATGLNIY